MSSGSAENSRRYRERHPGLAAARARAYKARNYELVKARKRGAWARLRERDPDKCRQYRRASRLKVNYGLTVEQHTAMYVVQNGCCAICGKPVEYDKIQTDHDHKTGKVRGLLCQSCNLALGVLEAREGVLYDMFKYLGW